MDGIRRFNVSLHVISKKFNHEADWGKCTRDY